MKKTRRLFNTSVPKLQKSLNFSVECWPYWIPWLKPWVCPELQVCEERAFYRIRGKSSLTNCLLFKMRKRNFKRITTPCNMVMLSVSLNWRMKGEINRCTSKSLRSSLLPYLLWKERSLYWKVGSLMSKM